MYIDVVPYYDQDFISFLFYTITNVSFQALALGGDFLAVATNKRHVRVFSLSGIQKNLFCIPGPVVSMAAEGQKLILVYHQGVGKISYNLQ